VQRVLHRGKFWFVSAEMKISATYARVPVADGEAGVPVLALHLLVGPGVYYQSKN
jgi:hypothetical protein